MWIGLEPDGEGVWTDGTTCREGQDKSEQKGEKKVDGWVWVGGEFWRCGLAELENSTLKQLDCRLDYWYMQSNHISTIPSIACTPTTNYVLHMLNNTFWRVRKIQNNKARAWIKIVGHSEDQLQVVTGLRTGSRIRWQLPMGDVSGETDSNASYAYGDVVWSLNVVDWLNTWDLKLPLMMLL